jgi:hypothetical protein
MPVFEIKFILSVPFDLFARPSGTPHMRIRPYAGPFHGAVRTGSFRPF